MENSFPNIFISKHISAWKNHQTYSFPNILMHGKFILRQNINALTISLDARNTTYIGEYEQKRKHWTVCIPTTGEFEQ